MEPTVELSLIAGGDAVGDIVALLSESGFEGFWEDGEFLRAYIGLSKWSDSLQADVRQTLDAYSATKGIQPPQIAVQTIPPRNWNAQWEDSIQPLRISPRMIIAPSWRSVKTEPGEILLTIDPKMSFGTGHHETTRLILSLLEQRIRKGDTMLDVGTGTGVLAIAAAKLGARHAVGVDIDEWSWDNARENIRINEVQGCVTVYRGELADVPEGVFDVVAANIQRSVIEPILPQLASRTVPQGHLLLAGLLSSERETMQRAFQQNGLLVEEERSENEWIAFSLRHA